MKPELSEELIGLIKPVIENLQENYPDEYFLRVFNNRVYLIKVGDDTITSGYVHSLHGGK